jgi:hypothetical protein
LLEPKTWRATLREELLAMANRYEDESLGLSLNLTPAPSPSGRWEK